MAKGVKPKVRALFPPTKLRPIPRGRDNTDDLVEKEFKVRSSKISHPDGTRRGSFDPKSDAAYNGNVVSPPGGSSSQ